MTNVKNGPSEDQRQDRPNKMPGEETLDQKRRYYVFENPSLYPDMFREVEYKDVLRLCDSDEHILVIVSEDQCCGGVNSWVLVNLHDGLERHPDYNLKLTSDAEDISYALIKSTQAFRNAE